ncbi:Crp/Fnr family transcriptional regulator [Weeksellaceae bacterium TAE3-ERU29]|nr:Crp/Fnr family transcriptional regulator [Weeksellaceae bacterium TAE3-ERU29]
MISTDILLNFNVELINYAKGEIIFQESERANYYYQIKTGKVYMTVMNEEGKEFTQGVFSENDGFGEPPLFIGKTYPSTAKAYEDSEVYRLPKKVFFKILQEYPKYSFELNKKLSELLYFKSKMATEISLYNPEHRILTLFRLLKTKEIPERIQLTRQQIANLTALRVETVIRTIKSLESKGTLSIKNRKVYF